MAAKSYKPRNDPANYQGGEYSPPGGGSGSNWAPGTDWLHRMAAQERAGRMQASGIENVATSHTMGGYGMMYQAEQRRKRNEDSMDLHYQNVRSAVDYNHIYQLLSGLGYGGGAGGQQTGGGSQFPSLRQMAPYAYSGGGSGAGYPQQMFPWMNQGQGGGQAASNSTPYSLPGQG